MKLIFPLSQTHGVAVAPELIAQPPLPWVMHRLPLVVPCSQKEVEEESALALDNRVQAFKTGVKTVGFRCSGQSPFSAANGLSEKHQVMSAFQPVFPGFLR